MKYIACLTGLLGLLAFTGCVSDHHARGGYGHDTYYGHGYGYYDRDHIYVREAAPNYRGNARMWEHRDNWNQDYYHHN